jgi:deferrochelatase/peroxidase EfeB
MSDERLLALEDAAGDSGCPASFFARRSFLQGTAAGVVAAAGGSLLDGGEALAQGTSGDRATGSLIPFHGDHQAGILTTPQRTGVFASFDVTASGRQGLTELFRTLTARASLLAAGGTGPKASPNAPPPDSGILGPGTVPDDLTITVAVGASLFDSRFGLGARKPVQLVTMTPFRHDDLNPTLSQGDLLLQVCAKSRDTTVHAMLDILEHTKDAMKERWRFFCQRNPPRPTGIPRDWFGFKDGISNPATTSTTQMNQLVWTQPKTAEPAWAAGGTYQVVRVVHFRVEAWQKVPVAQQERIFGRRKISGAPHVRRVRHRPGHARSHLHQRPARPDHPAEQSHPPRQSPDRGDRGEQHHPASQLRLRGQSRRKRRLRRGARLLLLQRELNSYIAMQKRLEGEALVPYISPRGGGYFFALPGVRDEKDYYARGLLS